jgi:hypothetical protein
MFPALQTEILRRFQQIDLYYRSSPKKPADVAQTFRGLIFVQAYAAYEYTVRTAIHQAIVEIAAKGHSFRELKPCLLALFLDNELKAMRAAGEKRIWETRMALMTKTFSADPIAAVEAVPHDGNYYRHTQLQMTFDVLGVKRAITTRRRYRYTIDEVVDARNEIAHGEATAAEVGRRYSYSEMRFRIATMRKVCFRVVELLSEHCGMPDRHCR